MLFPCYFAGFLLFSPKGSVTGCDSSLACEFCYLIVYFNSRSCIFFPANIITTTVCSNRCADALVGYRNSSLNRLYIVHGGKILLIIIIIFQCPLFFL